MVHEYKRVAGSDAQTQAEEPERSTKVHPPQRSPDYWSMIDHVGKTITTGEIGYRGVKRSTAGTGTEVAFRGEVRQYLSEQLPNERYFVPLNEGGSEKGSIKPCTVSTSSGQGATTVLTDQKGVKWQMTPGASRGQHVDNYLTHPGPYDWTPVDVMTRERLSDE